jgi:hypothetical protein
MSTVKDAKKSEFIVFSLRLSTKTNRLVVAEKKKRPYMSLNSIMVEAIEASLSKKEASK